MKTFKIILSLTLPIVLLGTSEIAFVLDRNFNMLKKEDRISSRNVKSKSGQMYTEYSHECLGCKKEIWKTPSNEKVSTGLCQICLFEKRAKKKEFDSNGNRKCSKCKIPQPKSNFFESKKDYFNSMCLKCTNLTKYKISKFDYNLLLKKQNHACAICERPETKVLKKYNTKMDLAVDHCHTTGKIRGLLCHSCNTAIGHFEDNEKLLWKAIMYIKRKK